MVFISKEQMDAIKAITDSVTFPEVELDQVKIPGGRLKIDQRLSKVFPHKEHKGNLRVYWANNAGSEGSAECTMKDCGVVVRLKRK